MKIVFLAANCSYSHTNLAAWCLRTGVNESIWDWQTLEVTVKESPANVLAQIMDAKPDVVAATLYLFNHDFVAGLFGLLRELRPECRLVVGGPECLGSVEALAGMGGWADVAVRGEGELALPELLERWRTGRDWMDIPGLCGVDAQGVFRDNGSTLFVEDFDSIPPFYDRELVGFRKPFIQLETSRGCANGCLFCTSRHTARRIHSLDRVRNDLRAIAAAGVKDVRIVDRTFNEDRIRAVALVRIFRDEFPGIRFHLEIEPARFGRTLAEEFAVAEPGRFHLEVGIQSLAPDVCMTIQRGATITRTLDGLKRLCDLKNIEVHVDLIAGLPGSRLVDIIADLEKVMVFRPAEIQLERLKLLPGTPLAQDPGRWGIVSRAAPPYQVLHTATISAEDLEQSDRLSKLIDWYYNTKELHVFFADAIVIDSSFLTRFEEWIRQRMSFDKRPSLESRFESLYAFFQTEITGQVASSGALELVAYRLCYRWFRLGFSARNGLRPAVLLKKGVPQDAVLVEGDSTARVARSWRVDIDMPYLFCYGTGAGGERSVVAVYQLFNALRAEKAVDDGGIAV